MQEAFEELYIRFLMNLPEEEREPARLMKNLEEAHWYYEDFIRIQLGLPRFYFKTFAKKVIEQFPGLAPDYSFNQLMHIYDSYTSQIPTRGGILLNDDMTKAVMVTNIPGTSTSFPKGKMNEGEADVDCAVREVWEEIGFNIVKLLREEDSLHIDSIRNDMILYVIRGVPEDTCFETHTRGEISKIQWVKVEEVDCSIPMFRNVRSVIPRLKDWITRKQLAEKHFRPFNKLRSFKFNRLRIEGMLRTVVGN
mmetsp:Transcript_28666/g.51027  ORF Transcript_28666/g.51027 Transcript_28666/m.51027 type:complete len:251 (-) Transcript_28666:2195-2947(-)